MLKKERVDSAMLNKVVVYISHIFKRKRKEKKESKKERKGRQRLLDNKVF